MTFFVKVFTIVSAALAVAVNGSPAGFTGGRRDGQYLGDFTYYPWPTSTPYKIPAYFGRCNDLNVIAKPYGGSSGVYCYGYLNSGCSGDAHHIWSDEDPDISTDIGLIQSSKCYDQSILTPIAVPGTPF